MPDSLPAPVWVDKPADLDRLADALLRQPRIAVDTESNSLHAYREQVCLVQFSTPDCDYLVDPLTLIDLSCLEPVFADPSILKVFHAAEYDLICLKRDFGFRTINLFDTMQAARILGYRQVGLDGMLSEKMGIRLDKRYQKADWGRRPLPAEMLSYARLDTHHLLRLCDLLVDELDARQRLDLAREEFTRLAGSGGNGRGEIPSWQRVGGTQRFTARQYAVLQALCEWRERRAERMDRPVFKIMDDRQLAALAALQPRSPDDLVAAGLTRRQVGIFGRELLQAAREGGKAEPQRPSRRPHPDPAFLVRLDRLSEWRKQAAQCLGVESDIVLPKPWLHAIAERNPASLDELAGLMPDSPWRRAQFGSAILEALVRPVPKKDKSPRHEDHI